MARVVVTSVVYLGDVAPFIPVARRLHDAGHDVTFMAPEGFRSVLEPEPFAYRPYAMDCSPATMNADPVHTKLMRHPVRNVGRLGSYWMDRAFTDDTTAAVASLRDGFEGADVVVTHPTMSVATIPVARSVGAKVAVGHLFPMLIPTARWTPPMGPFSPDLGRPVNALAWRALRLATSRMFRDTKINAVRRQLGQDPVHGNAGWAWLGADRTVVLASQHYYGPAAEDWPPVSFGGFSIWHGPDGQALDPDLDAYVDAGDPPVLVTLGTSAATDASEQFARIARDLDAAGLRSVLLVGHETNLALVRDRPGAVAFAPITQLLPRCRVAVVSGALGGLAAALAAGVPVVIHPQLFDQVWHGRRVEQLGVGVMARKASDVGAAVKRIVDDPSYAERARALAAAMAGEDGSRVLADAVESLL